MSMSVSHTFSNAVVWPGLSMRSRGGILSRSKVAGIHLDMPYRIWDGPPLWHWRSPHPYPPPLPPLPSYKTTRYPIRIAGSLVITDSTDAAPTTPLLIPKEEKRLPALPTLMEPVPQPPISPPIPPYYYLPSISYFYINVIIINRIVIILYNTNISKLIKYL